MKLSAVVIAKNEEKKIADCLLSLAFCDEILVIDSGSSDKTKEIAREHHARVFLHQTNDFSDLRNYGLSQAKGEWILYLDADERVTPALRENIQFQISNFKYPITAYRLKRKNYYFGQYEWPYIEKLERLFKKDALIEWYGLLHESPKVKGNIGELDGFIIHYSHDDLSSMIRKTNKWSDVEASIRFKAHHPKMTWWRFPRVMLTAFWDSYIRQSGFRAGTAGLIESIYQSFSIFITYAKLWELQNEKEKNV